ncbi:hypothetical protein BEP19_04375 [Ammoniphilus oxalaticus]|uniref:DUF2680 domain-containing protein n=2 Tax=Ammoniphilus oxalaticus TaxID=66863 RepID=A0A419SM68_9BACL|nr:hypothetical protein BEP19_04375 [Ammoniphilus oxalaticus]
MAFFTGSLSFGGGALIQAEESGVNETVQLTEQQQQELAKLHKKMIEQHKKVVAKYVEFGVFSKDKGEKIDAMLDKKYEKLEQNGFIPKWEHKKYHKDNE